MNIGTYLYLIILFVVFSPGIIFSIPSSNSSSKWVRVFIHGFLFSVAWLLTHKPVNNMYSSIREGIENNNSSSTITTSEGTSVMIDNGTTPYQPPPPPPPPPLPYIDRIRIIAKKNDSDNYISLAEVQVWDESGRNVALGKKTTQSSTGWGGDASRAVDGNTSGNWFDSSTTHTYNGANEYWELDLTQKYSIKEIKIFNRTDCCWKRLEGASLQLINGSVVNKTFTLTAEFKQVFKF